MNQNRQKPKPNNLERDQGSSNKRGQKVPIDFEEPEEGDQPISFNTRNNFTPIVPKPFIPHVSPKLDLFSTITVYGKRKTGKSVFVKWYVQFYKKYFPWAWVFTKTKQNSWYASMVPEKFILNDFSGQILRKIMEGQVKGIKEFLDRNENLNPRAILIWDDYNGKDIKYNEALEDYYYTGRHFATMNFFCAQVIFFLIIIYLISK